MPTPAKPTPAKPTNISSAASVICDILEPLDPEARARAIHAVMTMMDIGPIAPKRTENNAAARPLSPTSRGGTMVMK